MPENDKTGTEEENLKLRCVQDNQKDGRKKVVSFQETPVECSNGWEMSTRLLNNLKNHGNRILIFPMKKLSPIILSLTNRIIGS